VSDEWDSYICLVENNAASIFVDLGIRAEAPMPYLRQLVWLRLHLRQPHDNGLPTNEEFNRLIEIEDALEDAAQSARDSIVYVGRNSSNGCREFYFYASNGHVGEACLSSAMVPFAEYEFETGSRSDPEWSAYFGFLFPSRRNYQTILNRRVVDQLEEHGDKHEIEREVCHWINFTSIDGRANFLAATLDLGYERANQFENGEGEHPFGVTVKKAHSVDYPTIDQHVLELFDLAERYNGDYDGWESSVERGTS
jgi:uncharacterized protein (TIGR01619 family)